MHFHAFEGDLKSAGLIKTNGTRVFFISGTLQ